MGPTTKREYFRGFEMADAKQMQFGQRLSRIDQNHRKLAKGYVTTMTKDGLIIARPQRRSSRLPARGLFLSLLVLLTFKGFVYAQIGEIAYQSRVDLLAQGTIVEQIGSYAMYADPITLWIAQQFASII